MTRNIYVYYSPSPRKKGKRRNFYSLLQFGLYYLFFSFFASLIQNDLLFLKNK